MAKKTRIRRETVITIDEAIEFIGTYNAFGRYAEALNCILAELLHRQAEIDRLNKELEKQDKRTEVWEYQVHQQWTVISEAKYSFERLSGKCYEELEKLDDE
jgi:hypothetical protein